MAANHSRQQWHETEIGFDRDGRIVALIDRFITDMGAWLRTHGVVVPELTAALLPGPYRIPHYRSEARCVLTNKTPTVRTGARAASRARSCASGSWTLRRRGSGPIRSS